MLLAVDIGNSNIKFGVYDGREWVHFWPIETVRTRMPAEYAVLLRSFLADAGIERGQFERAIVSSVVPQLTVGMLEMLERETGCRPLLLRHDLDTGLAIKTDQPEVVGADLIANAVAGFNRFKSNCIVVNFGTATTLSAVARGPSGAGEFRGASIAAGLAVTANALVSGAAQLSHVELAAPPSVIGTNTRHAMQSGLVLGHVAMIEGLIARMRAQLDDAKVIATGGLAQILAPLTDSFDAVDQMLTLEGLRIVAERNE
ncbi:MAG TPA: type III pantothenate kinase [Thermomicrobiales bacterium]|nr:type III pantothenate kinase [Thermomicrobiales bacterium]